MGTELTARSGTEFWRGGGFPAMAPVLLEGRADALGAWRCRS